MTLVEALVVGVVFFGGRGGEGGRLNRVWVETHNFHLIIILYSLQNLIVS